MEDNGKSKKFKLEASALRAYTMLGALVVIWLFFHYQTDSIFLTPRNLSNLMLQTSVTGIIAIGMLMVIVSGNIDLSVGSLLALAGGVAAIFLTKLGYGLVPSILAAIAVGVLIGLFQGFLTAYGNIPAFIVTLGGLLAWRGAIKGISESETIPVVNDSFKAIGQSYIPYEIGWIVVGVLVALLVFFATFKSGNKLFSTIAGLLAGFFVGYLVPYLYFWLGTEYLIYGLTRPQSLLVYSVVLLLLVFIFTAVTIAAVLKQSKDEEIRKSIGGQAIKNAFYAVGVTLFVMVMSSYEGVPVAVMIFLSIAFLGFFITNNTTFGRYIYAIGGNAEAARLSGINNKLVVLKVFAILGAFTGIASLIYTARVAAATPDAGTLLELDAIAACVIGGTSLMGGRGTVFGACLGALIMASLDNGMSLLNLPDFMQELIKGSILVAAVGLDMLGRKS